MAGMKAGLFLSLALLLGACVAAAERPAPYDPFKVRPVGERFEATAFYGGSGEDMAEHPLWRWRIDPVLDVLFVHDRYPGKAERWLDWAIGDIQETTGMRIRRAGPWRPTLTVVFDDVDGMFAQDREAAVEDIGHGCWSSVHVDATGAIERAIVFVPFILALDHRHACLVRGLTRAMGLTGDLAAFGRSVLDSGSTDARLSHQERQLLIILYDRHLPIGIGRAEAMPIVDRIIAERGWPPRPRYRGLPKD
jgi:hypothetical protein